MSTRDEVVRARLLAELSTLRETHNALRAKLRKSEREGELPEDYSPQSYKKESGQLLGQADRDAIEAFFNNSEDDFTRDFNEGRGRLLRGRLKMVALVGKSKIRRIGRKKGATLKDVHAWRWVKLCGQHFKQEGRLFVPNCAEIVKTSHGRERAPQNPDWYYVRCAAVLRAVYMRPGVGYGGLSKRFSCRKNRGSRPEITTRAAKGLLHWACKSLIKLGLVEKCTESGHRVTKKGRKVADTLAFQVHVRRFNNAKQEAR